MAITTTRSTNYIGKPATGSDLNDDFDELYANDVFLSDRFDTVAAAGSFTTISTTGLATLASASVTGEVTTDLTIADNSDLELGGTGHQKHDAKAVLGYNLAGGSGTSAVYLRTYTFSGDSIIDLSSDLGVNYITVLGINFTATAGGVKVSFRHDTSEIGFYDSAGILNACSGTVYFLASS